MNKIKKFFSLFFTLICLFTFASCGKNKDDKKEVVPFSSLKVLSINDVHGAIESDDETYAAAGLAWYINKERAVDGQAVLVLSAGDMFQGSAVSNYSFGKNVVELMNEMKFDAMTIGNHEFDWGLDTILGYNDGNKENGEANFPFISCNIIDKSTNEPISSINPYTIIDYKDFQIGVVGYIGTGLESDISANRVKDYYFADPVEYIAKYSKELRNNGCEMVIALGHDAFDATNTRIAALSGDNAVDMIINGHTHAVYTRFKTNGNNVSIPVTQAGTASECVTETTFDFNKDSNTFGQYTKCKNIDLGNYEIEIDETVDNMVKRMVAEIAPIMDEKLIVAGKGLSRSSVASWIADEIYNAVDCDFAAINSGGVRSSAFPISEGTSVTVKKIYEIMPFDNLIKVGQFTGQEVINIITTVQEVFSSNVDLANNTINGETIDLEKTYTFACVDYLFDRDAVIYDASNDTTIVQMLIRDIMIEALRDLNASGETWIIK